jgi:hypothetical protein
MKNHSPFVVADENQVNCGYVRVLQSKRVALRHWALPTGNLRVMCQCLQWIRSIRCSTTLAHRGLPRPLGQSGSAFQGCRCDELWPRASACSWDTTTCCCSRSCTLPGRLPHHFHGAHSSHCDCQTNLADAIDSWTVHVGITISTEVSESHPCEQH